MTTPGGANAELSHLYRGAAMRGARFGRALLTVVAGSPTPEDFDGYADNHRRGADEIGHGILTVTLITTRTMHLDKKVRDASFKLARALHGRVVASSTVVESSGLLGAAHRSVITGIQMVLRNPYPEKVFGDLDEAATWLGGFDASVQGATLRRALDELR